MASEYALLITFIAIIAATGMVLLGPNIAAYFAAVGAGAVPNTLGTPPCPLGGCGP